MENIRHYCSSNLSNNLGFAALQRGDPNAASDPSKTSQRRRVVSFSMPSLLSIPTRRLDRWGATFLFEKVAGFAAIGSDNPLLVNLKLRRFRKGFTAIADCTSLAESNQHSPFIICWRAWSGFRFQIANKPFTNYNDLFKGRTYDTTIKCLWQRVARTSEQRLQKWPACHGRMFTPYRQRLHPENRHLGYACQCN